MPVVPLSSLIKLQQDPESIRNICVLAHVDHGKTSLSDSLIATNGIISPKMAGKVRYLDSRPDEQVRGITMESSAISLLFSLMRKKSIGDSERQDHLINLIDSPGHVDFSSEVSTASRLCDGALVLVDALEGVCSQTITVLRQTWIENMKPVLVINKLDRLVTELKMTASEAYAHLSKLIEQVNAVVGSFYQGERMEEDLKWRENLESKVNAASDSRTQQGDGSVFDDAPDRLIDSGGSSWQERNDEDIYFEPEKGNVIFASATDGFAFTVKQFASFWEKKLGIKMSLLERFLWGDYYLEPKTKRILSSKHLKGRQLKPMFVQLVLENIWAVYDAAVGGDKGRGDSTKIEKITKALSINLPAHIVRSKDARAVLTALFTAWIPLSTAVLVSVIEHLPSPLSAQKLRTANLLATSPGGGSVDQGIRDAMTCLKGSKSDPVVAFVSKMVSVPQKDLPEHKTWTGASLTPDEARELGRKKRAEVARAQAAANGEHPDVAELRESLGTAAALTSRSEATEALETEQDDDFEQLIGFARLFSGTIEVGDEIYVLGPKFTPAQPHLQPEPQSVTVTGLYMFMGRELEPLKAVPPGVVFGIGGLAGHIMKSGTLCSKVSGGVNLAGVMMGGQPIVRVAVEPENPSDLARMVRGMRMLEQSDPCAVYEVLENGEHVILTAGELHLERCMKDLRERFAKCELQTGPPIVPYRESILAASEMNPPKSKDLTRGTVLGANPMKSVSIRLRVKPLPFAATEYLLHNASQLKVLSERQDLAEQYVKSDSNGDLDDAHASSLEDSGPSSRSTGVGTLDEVSSGLLEIFKQEASEADIWTQAIRNCVAFGPRSVGPNVLVDSTQDRICKAISIEGILSGLGQAVQEARQMIDGKVLQHDLISKIMYAFQLATAQGPLCNEAMQGVAVFIEDCRFPSTAEDEAGKHSTSARLTGEVIRIVRDSIWSGFLDWSPRLLMAMYSCEIQASAEVLGRVYGVIARRRGRILAESMNEGTPFFTIAAMLPVAESFGFSEEIRKRTSGAASPQLIFSGYEMLDEDPFWVPFTEEELEDLGDTADRENLAKKYMNEVRQRKGLFVQGKKLVESAEKQKTLKK